MNLYCTAKELQTSSEVQFVYEVEFFGLPPYLQDHAEQETGIKLQNYQNLNAFLHLASY